MQHSPCYLNMAVKSQLRNQKATLDSKRCLNSRSLMIVLRTRMNETPKDFRWALTKSLLPLNLRSISSFIPYGRGPAGALSQLTPHNYKPEFPTAPCLQPDNYENASPSTLSCPTLTSPNMGTSLDWWLSPELKLAEGHLGFSALPFLLQLWHWKVKSRSVIREPVGRNILCDCYGSKVLLCFFKSKVMICWWW